METRNDNLRLAKLVAEWYSLNADVRQLSVYEADGADSCDACDACVMVALIPVCDSDDISPIWLAKCTGWQRQLEALLERRVHLDWFDGEPDVMPGAGESERARVCLANVAWRDCCAAQLLS